MPVELGAIDAHQEDAVGNLETRIAGRIGEAWDLAWNAVGEGIG